MAGEVNTNYKFNAAQLLAQFWGYKNLTYFPRTAVNAVDKSKYEQIQAADYKFIQKSSMLGTPIIMPVKIQISAAGQELQMYDLPDEPVVEIKSSKKIVETEIDGQDGTFKELYSLGDYSITIRGIITNTDFNDDSYPEDVVRSLRTIYELKHHVKVSCPLFSLFNIEYLALTSFDLPYVEGSVGMQPYEFMALSDKDFKLELKAK
jgi:hypothetical protein